MLSGSPSRYTPRGLKVTKTNRFDIFVDEILVPLGGVSEHLFGTCSARAGSRRRPLLAAFWNTFFAHARAGKMAASAKKVKFTPPGKACQKCLKKGLLKTSVFGAPSGTVAHAKKCSKIGSGLSRQGAPFWTWSRRADRRQVRDCCHKSPVSGPPPGSPKGSHFDPRGSSCQIL